MLYMINATPQLVKDKGFAWCILVMSFLSHSVHIGFSYAVLGNLTIAHKKKYGLTIQESSTIGSVHSGLFFILAPFASVLVKKIKCRLTELLGGACLIAGIGLSSLASQPWHTYLLFSVLAACGVACCYVATSEILALHFVKYKYLAFALAVLGYYVGMVAWPSVSQNLLENQGYSKAMGIMSALHVIHIIAGILFFQPDDNEVEDIDTEYKSNTSKQLSGHDNKALEGEISDDSIISSKMKTNDVEAEVEESDEEENLIKDFRQLLTTPKVWALLINGLLWNTNVASFLILINDYIEHKIGITGEESALGITILGIANLVGCVCVIVTSSLSYDRVILHFGCSLVYGSITIIIAFSDTKVMFYILTAIWGLAQAAHISNLLAVFYDFCSVKQLALLFGILLFFEGVGAIAGIPLISYISSLNREYGIVLAGLFGIVSSLVILPVIINKYRIRRQATSSALKAIVLAQNPGQQRKIVQQIKEAAGPEYPHIPTK